MLSNSMLLRTKKLFYLYHKMLNNIDNFSYNYLTKNYRTISKIFAKGVPEISIKQYFGLEVYFGFSSEGQYF